MNLLSPPVGGMSAQRSARLAAVGPWTLGSRRPAMPKSVRGVRRVVSLAEAVAACGLSDGSVVSFHHHFRDGDRAILRVMTALADAGLRDLTVAASSLFSTHGSLLPLIASGVITRIITDYVRGPVSDAIVDGCMPRLAVLQSHGGRARAIASGELRIDAAFIAAPLAHVSGAATGRGGRLACGPLGYAMVDAAHARTTVVLADSITETMSPHVEIPAYHVDLLVPFADPGDPGGIRSGSTLPQDSPQARLIADTVVRVIQAAGLIRPGFSFQTGAGGYSLRAVPAIGRCLSESGVVADYISGGIAAAHVTLLERGLVRRIRDVQSFDLSAVRSSITHPDHHAMSAADYASPDNPNAAVEGLSVMLLGAGEVDRGFNVNVAIGGNGQMIGGPGGHPDAAQGAELAIVTTGLTGGGFAKIVADVACVTTPGSDVDVVVTDEGVAVNPARNDLGRCFSASGLKVESMEALLARASARSQSHRREAEGEPVVVVEHREGGVLDAIRKR